MRLIFSPVPTGTVDFITSACAVGRRHRVDDRVHRGQIGVTRVGRRRADGDEQQPRVLQRVGELGGEVHPVAMAGDQLLQTRLPDRDPPLLRSPAIFSASMSMQ